MPTNETSAAYGEKKQTASIEQQKITDPYIGPRPFRRDPDDQKRFFGRDREADEILSLIFAHQLVLIYAQSGAGKTSILNAQVVPALEKYGYIVLPTARVGVASDTKVGTKKFDNTDNITSHGRSNFYMFNALQSLKPESDSGLFVNKLLYEFLAEYFPLRKEISDKLKPRVLVFDQLEEIFRFFPDNTWRQQQENFFEQVAEALEKDSLLRIVFVIREDYLAELDHFIRILPERLRPRFRLERLRKDAAFRAIKGPLERTSTNLSQLLETEEINKQIEELVNDLLKIRVEDPLTGEPQQIDGEFVEPIQLQLVCRRWWQEKSSSRKTASQTHIKLEKSLTDVDKALKEFYEDALRAAVSSTRISEDTVRAWFDEKFITASGTRSFVHHRAFIQRVNNVPDRRKIEQAIESLQKSYIIRAEWRSGAKWYELTHDRLIGPIKSSNEAESRKPSVRLRRSLKKSYYSGDKIDIRRQKISTAVMVIVFAIFGTAIIYFIYPIEPEGLPLGQTPSYLSSNPNTNRIYVSNSGNNSVSVIDGLINKVIKNIPVATAPSSLSVNPETNLIYVVGRNDSSTNEFYSDSASGGFVSVIDGRTDQLVKNITMDSDMTPTDIDVNPETNLIYVVGRDSSTNEFYSDSASDSASGGFVSVIDGTSNEIIDEVSTDSGVGAVSIDPQTNTIYVAGMDSISVINGTTNQIPIDISVDNNIRDLYVNPETNMLYVSDFDSNAVYIIHGNEIEAILKGPESPSISVNEPTIDIDINPQTNMIYAATSDSITIINGTTNKVVDSIRDVTDLVSISSNPQTNMIYAASSDSITIINGTTNLLVNEITPDSDAIFEKVNVNPQTNMIYITGYTFYLDTDSVSGFVSVIDGRTDQLVKNITMDSDMTPTDIDVNPETNLIYVVGRNDSSTNEFYSDSASGSASGGFVSVIDGRTDQLVKNITMDSDVTSMSVGVNPQTNKVYVTGYLSFDSASSFVSVIDGTTNEVVDYNSLIHIGSSEEIALNPKTNLIYVVSSSSESVSVIHGTTNEILINP
jgi:YVTN family beta-propeller protein